MMMRGVSRLAPMLICMAACIPDFQLDTRTFPEAGARADAEPEDMGASEAATLDANEVADSGAIDSGAEEDAVVPTDIGPPIEDCENGGDDDGDDAADCADPDCDLHVGPGSTWQCRELVKAETDCDNNLDDDGNDGFDCHDPDCGCALGLTCCPNGACISLPDVCG
jgi:hypothetical protein